MASARVNGTVIAKSHETIVVEGTHYFPRGAVLEEYLEPSDTTTFCGWKGTARYYTVVVNGQRFEDAAWYYPAPMKAAQRITDHIAFWRGVNVEG